MLPHRMCWAEVFCEAGFKILGVFPVTATPAIERVSSLDLYDAMRDDPAHDVLARADIQALAPAPPAIAPDEVEIGYTVDELGRHRDGPWEVCPTSYPTSFVPSSGGFHSAMFRESRGVTCGSTDGCCVFWGPADFLVRTFNP